MKNKMKALFSDRRGLTLVEMLATVVIVLLMSATLAMGIRLAVYTYRQSIEVSESQQLFGTLKMVLTGELQYTNKVWKDDNGNTQFHSAHYWVKNVNESSDLMLLKKNGKEPFSLSDTAPTSAAQTGELVFAMEEGGEWMIHHLLSTKAYPNDLGVWVKIEAVPPADDTKAIHHFHVTLEVWNQTRAIIDADHGAFDVLYLGDYRME